MNSRPLLYNDEAYWISQEGEIYTVETTHIGMVFDSPALFGLTERFIKSVYDLYNEEYRTEGKARKEIILMILTGGWIRARRYTRPCRWTLNTSSFVPSPGEPAARFAASMIKQGHSGHEEALLDLPDSQKIYTLAKLSSFAEQQ